ncbi:Nlrp4c [Symbiodinium natans]|uniref:Nlrp4c protein n=1 Tax=Symbiodinium natans TaxID=878477 RepID=A0A812RJE4_9DINO|nr:Nlrp4c [Symbiodinium natans]
MMMAHRSARSARGALGLGASAQVMGVLMLLALAAGLPCSKTGECEAQQDLLDLTQTHDEANSTADGLSEAIAADAANPKGASLDAPKIVVLCLFAGGMLSWILATIKWAVDGSLPARLAVWGLLPEAFAAVSVRSAAALLNLKSGSTPVLVLKTCVSDSNVEELAKALREHGKRAELQALELPYNHQLSDAGVRRLVEAVTEAEVVLEELDLSFNAQLGDAAVRAVQPLCMPPSRLSTLRLVDCSLGREALSLLAEQASRLRLNTLHLSANNLTGLGEVLAEVMEAPVLEDLALVHCGLSLEDLTNVAEQLPYTSLKSIQLASNQIDGAGLKVLAEQLPKTQLDELGLEQNLLKSEDLSCLGTAWAKRPFSRLRLGGNSVEKEEVANFIKTLRFLQA